MLIGHSCVCVAEARHQAKGSGIKDKRKTDTKLGRRCSRTGGVAKWGKAEKTVESVPHGEGHREVLLDGAQRTIISEGRMCSGSRQTASLLD